MQQIKEEPRPVATAIVEVGPGWTAELPTSVETPAAKRDSVPPAQTIPDAAWTHAQTAQREHEERIARDLSHDRPARLAHALANPPGPRHAKLVENDAGKWELERRHVHDPLTMADRATCGPCNVERRRDAGNPKDGIGSAKAPITTWPLTVIAEGGVAMLEGALKYGRHNYRAADVKASVYIDAAVNRHLAPWFDGGEDIDPDSGISHLTKAIVGLAILRDAMICGHMIDDRPPPSPPGFFRALNDKAAELVAKYPNPVPPYTARKSIDTTGEDADELHVRLERAGQ